MSEWQVRIPFRDRDALALSEIYDVAGEVLGDEDARVARQLAYDALIRGPTAGRPGCSTRTRGAGVSAMLGCDRQLRRPRAQRRWTCTA